MTVNLTRIYTKLGDGGETAPRRHEPRLQAAPPRRGLRDGRRAERRDRPGAARSPACPARFAEWLRAGAERPARPRRGPVGAGAPRSARPEATARARACASTTDLHDLARGGLRRGQRDARAAALVRDPRRHAGGSAPAPRPHRLPARRAARDRRRRGGQPRGGALPQPPLGPAVHPQPRRQPAAAGAEQLWEPGAHGEPLWDPGAHGSPPRRRRLAPLLSARGRRARASGARRRAAPPPPGPSRGWRPGSRRGHRWACARRGSAAPARRPARTAPPSTATRARQRGAADEHRAQHQRERGGRVPARARRPTPMLDAFDAVVGVGEQRLEQLGGERRQGHHDGDRERDPRARARQRDGHQGDRPRCTNSSGSSRCSRKSATSSTPGRLSSVKSCSATASRRWIAGTSSARPTPAPSRARTGRPAARARAALGARRRGARRARRGPRAGGCVCLSGHVYSVDSA